MRQNIQAGQQGYYWNKVQGAFEWCINTVLFGSMLYISKYLYDIPLCKIVLNTHCHIPGFIPYIASTIFFVHSMEMVEGTDSQAYSKTSNESVLQYTARALKRAVVDSSLLYIAETHFSSLIDPKTIILNPYLCFWINLAGYASCSHTY